jgi:hypothetical protein
MPSPQWTTRQQITNAFWNLLITAQGFSQYSPRFVHWDQVASADQLPYLTKIKTGEERIRQSDGTPVIKFYYHVFVYTMIGQLGTDPEPVVNGLLDAVDYAVQATGSDIGENRQTLGGLVYYCQPRGRVFVDAGETDGKGVSAIPFEILAPWMV